MKPKVEVRYQDYNEDHYEEGWHWEENSLPMESWHCDECGESLGWQYWEEDDGRRGGMHWYSTWITEGDDPMAEDTKFYCEDCVE